MARLGQGKKEVVISKKSSVITVAMSLLPKTRSSKVVFAFIGLWGAITVGLLYFTMPQERVTVGYLTERGKQLANLWPSIPQSEKDRRLKKYVQAFINFLRTHPSADNKQKARFVLAQFLDQVGRNDDAVFWYSQYSTEAGSESESFKGIEYAVSNFSKSKVSPDKMLEVLESYLDRFSGGKNETAVRSIVFRLKSSQCDIVGMLGELGWLYQESFKKLILQIISFKY